MSTSDTMALTKNKQGALQKNYRRCHIGGNIQ